MHSSLLIAINITELAGIHDHVLKQVKTAHVDTFGCHGNRRVLHILKQRRAGW